MSIDCQKSKVSVSWWLILGTIATITITGFSLVYFRRYLSKQPVKIPPLLAILSYSLVPFFIVITFVFVGFWSTNVYPSITSTYGGGEATTIQIVPKDENAASLLEASGIRLNEPNINEPHITDDLIMIDETNDTILILKDSHSAVRISKDYIGNIIYRVPGIWDYLFSESDLDPP